MFFFESTFEPPQEIKKAKKEIFFASKTSPVTIRDRWRQRATDKQTLLTRHDNTPACSYNTPRFKSSAHD